METLKHITLEVIRSCIFQWKMEENNDDRMNRTVQLISYFEKLPYNVREEILSRFNLTNFWFYNEDHVVPHARHVAPFLHEDQKQIRMEFMSEDFDLDFLFEVSGHKLKNLTELKLPDECSITATACEAMRHLTPNLQKLDLSGCYLELGAMFHVAKLPLVELDPGDSITDEDVKQLCGEDSEAKKTLRVLKLGDSEVSLESYCLVLQTMKLMEDMDSFDCTWFNALPPSALQQKYNIRRLSFVFYIDSYDELNIGVATCPKVSEVCIMSSIFTAKMLHTLWKFRELRTLNVSVYANSEVTVEEEENKYDRVCLDNLCFENLVEFSLGDPKDYWISSGYLFAVLEMFPNLEKLQLFQCEGFSNKMASDLAKMMAKKKLKRLMIDYCELLGPYGLEDLLKIPSLVDLRANLYVTAVTKQHFEVYPLQQMAETHGVNFKLNLSFAGVHQQNQEEV